MTILEREVHLFGLKKNQPRTLDNKTVVELEVDKAITRKIRVVDPDTLERFDTYRHPSLYGDSIPMKLVREQITAERIRRKGRFWGSYIEYYWENH